MFKNYHNQNQNASNEDSPSEIEKDQKLIQNMMMHIEGDDDTNPLNDEDEDLLRDK